MQLAFFNVPVSVGKFCMLVTLENLVRFDWYWSLARSCVRHCCFQARRTPNLYFVIFVFYLAFALKAVTRKTQVFMVVVNNAHVTVDLEVLGFTKSPGMKKNSLKLLVFSFSVCTSLEGIYKLQSDLIWSTF